MSTNEKSPASKISDAENEVGSVAEDYVAEFEKRFAGQRFEDENAVKDFVDEPLPSDILCGRGQNSNHPGNAKFRELVNHYKQPYTEARCRNDKSVITQKIVAELRENDSPCRFLLKDPATNRWYAVSDLYARDKVSHALRSKPWEGRKKPLRTGPKQKRVVKKPSVPPETESTVQKLIEQQEKLLATLIENDLTGGRPVQLDGKRKLEDVEHTHV